jgi:hypothetical protein
MPQGLMLNLDQMDDTIIGDGTPSFTGGQNSNERASLIMEVESALLLNADRNRIGKVTTRKGSERLGTTGPSTAAPGSSGIVQGMVQFWTKDHNYLVAAVDGKIYKFEGGSWTQIATGGAFTNDKIEIIKQGAINQPSNYDVGATVLDVDGFVGSVSDGDKFLLWARDKETEYTILSHVDTAGNLTQITIDEPGIFTDVFNNDKIVVKRIGGKLSADAAAGATTISVSGLTGTLRAGGIIPDLLVLIDEGKIHHITSFTGTVATITFTEPIQGVYVSATTTEKIMFARGVDKIFWTDGIGDIHSWDGIHTGNLANGNPWDLGSMPAPTACKTLVWFQNRLIAGGLAAEPDAIYFSDILDPTRWDRNFNQIRVGGGESDPIVMLVPWMDLNLVVFKENSVYVINMDPSQNPTPEDSTLIVASFAIKLLTRHIGCASPHSISQVGGQGGDIFFLGSDREVRSLRRTVAAEQQQELGLALSIQVRDVLARIHTDFLKNCVASYWNDHYILGIPVDADALGVPTELPNLMLVFDTAFNNWAGVWEGWRPTAFATRLIGEGKQALAIGQVDGTVLQWLEDINPDELDPDTYKDNGVDITTKIRGRAYTFGDVWAWKTGLNFELEFTDSIALINVLAILDGMERTVLSNYDTHAYTALTLPFPLPSTLPTVVFRRMEKDLHQYGQFKELQLEVSSTAGKLSLRNIKVSGFMDSLQIQTLGDTPLPVYAPPGT